MKRFYVIKLNKDQWRTLLALRCLISVPGDGGTQFEAKLNKTVTPHSLCVKKTTDYFSLWLNLEELAPVVIDCFTDNMKYAFGINFCKTNLLL